MKAEFVRTTGNGRWYSPMTVMLESLFHLSENRTSVRTEVLAGTTTFATSGASVILGIRPAAVVGFCSRQSDCSITSVRRGSVEQWHYDRR